MKVYVFVISIIPFFLLGVFCRVSAQQDFVQQNLGSETTQGLKHIQDKAIDFVERYNQEHYTNWHVLEPNPKTIVPQCVIPLTAKWGRVFMEGYKSTISVERYVVFVICQKDIMQKSWTVNIPTTRPDRVTVHK